jgi:hypothetical protein
VELGQAVRALLLEPARRIAMGRAAAAFVNEERSLDATAARLDRALALVLRDPERPQG